MECIENKNFFWWKIVFLSNNWPNDLLGKNVHKTYESCQ